MQILKGMKVCQSVKVEKQT